VRQVGYLLELEEKSDI